jgi:hypothetical protein
MMALPFFFVLAAIGLAWRRRHGLAVGVGLAALLLTLGLFHLHATDSLALLF